MLPSGEKKTIDGFEYENKTSLDVRVSQVYIASHHSYFSYEVDKDETLSMKTIVPLPRESVARIILVPYKTRCRVEFE